MDVARHLARRLAETVLPAVEPLCGDYHQAALPPADSLLEAAPLDSLMALLERANSAMEALPYREVAHNPYLRALLWATYLQDLPALLLTLSTRDPASHLLGRLVQRVVKSTDLLLCFPPGSSPPQFCWPGLSTLAALLAMEPPLIRDPDTVLNCRRRLLRMLMAINTLASAPGVSPRVAAQARIRTLLSLARQTVRGAVQLGRQKLEQAASQHSEGVGMRQLSDAAAEDLLVTARAGAMARGCLHKFQQQWQEALSERGVDGWLEGQALMQDCEELLRFVLQAVDWDNPSFLQELYVLAAHTLDITLDPWAASLPPPGNPSRKQYLRTAAPLLLRLASTVCAAVHKTVDTWQGRQPTTAQQKQGVLGMLPRLALRVPLLLLLVQQQSSQPPLNQDGALGRGPDASLPAPLSPHPAPPAGEAAEGLGPPVPLGEGVPLVDSALRVIGKSSEMVRLVPYSEDLLLRLSDGLAMAATVLVSLINDSHNALQAAALPAETATQQLPALKSLLASCCKLACLASQAPVDDDSTSLQLIVLVPHLGVLIIVAAQLVTTAVLLKAGVDPPLPHWQGEGSLNKRMRRVGFLPLVSIPALLAVKRRIRELQSIQVLDDYNMGMARYFSMVTDLGVEDEAVSAGLGELMLADLLMQLDLASSHSSDWQQTRPDVLLLLYGTQCLPVENTRLATVLVTQGLVPALVHWCGRQARRHQSEKRILAGASVLLQCLCIRLDFNTGPHLVPLLARLMPNIPDPLDELLAHSDPFVSLEPYQTAMQPRPWQQVEAELLPKLQAACSEDAARTGGSRARL